MPNSPHGNTDAESAANPFPETELPRWILRQAKSMLWRLVQSAKGYPYGQLSQFAYNLRICVDSSADIVRGMELCVNSLGRTAIGSRLQGATQAVRSGMTFTESLQPAEDLLPKFFLPVITAGERSGRLGEALQFLETHCKLMAGPASALRNVWFYPAVILIGASAIGILIALSMGSISVAIGQPISTVFFWVQIVVIVAVLKFTPAKYFVDRFRLQAPLIGQLEKEIAINRFFRVLSLVYAVGGYRVEQMIEMAAKTVGNNAARLDLLRAVRAIEEGQTVGDAFRRASLVLAPQEMTTIESGDLSGTLEKAFDHLSEESGASMVHKLKLVQLFATRIAYGFAMLMLIQTMIQLAI